MRAARHFPDGCQRVNSCTLAALFRAYNHERMTLLAYLRGRHSELVARTLDDHEAAAGPVHRPRTIADWPDEHNMIPAAERHSSCRGQPFACLPRHYIGPSL